MIIFQPKFAYHQGDKMGCQNTRSILNLHHLSKSNNRNKKILYKLMTIFFHIESGPEFFTHPDTCITNTILIQKYLTYLRNSS